jgi:hypothetical protein
MRNTITWEKQIKEILTPSPNDLGWEPLTILYKKIVLRLKNLPFIIIIPLSLLLSFAIYLAFGYLIVKLVSWLQLSF